MRPAICFLQTLDNPSDAVKRVRHSGLGKGCKGALSLASGWPGIVAVGRVCGEI